MHSAALPKLVTVRGSARDLVELALAYGLILITVWVPNPPQRYLFWVCFVWIVGSTIARRDSLRTLGLGLTGLLRSLWIIGAALLCAAVAIVIASRLGTVHRLHGPTPMLSHVRGYLVWSVMQQFILQSYFLLRLLRLLPNRSAAVFAAAGIFSLAHLPNPILTPVTLLWGILACSLFLRYRNIYALGFAHGILGLTVAIVVPNALHRHMRVGLGYLRYHPSGRDRSTQDHRSQMDHSVSTEACVTADAPTLRL